VDHDNRGESFRAGPYLRAAVPSLLAAEVPLDGSSLLYEFEHGIDPIRALRVTARTWMHQRWTLEDKFVVPSWNTLSLLRQAAEDNELRSGLRTCPGVVTLEDESYRISDLARGDDGEPLSDYVLPILTGLAIVSTAITVHGIEGFGLWKTTSALPMLPAEMDSERAELQEAARQRAIEREIQREAEREQELRRIEEESERQAEIERVESDDEPEQRRRGPFRSG